MRDLDEQKMQLAKHYTENASAYQSYLMGLYFWNKRNKEGVATKNYIRLAAL
jgi:hypothetical protein